MFLKNLNRKLKSFRVRLIFYYTVLFSFSLLTLFLVGYFFFKQALIKKDDEFLYEELREYTDIYAKGGLHAVMDLYHAENPAPFSDRIFVRIITPQKEELFSAVGQSFEAMKAELNDNEIVNYRRIFRLHRQTDRGAITLDIISTQTKDGNILQIGFPTTDRIQLLQTYTEIFTWISGVATLLSLCIGYFLSTRALHPISAIRNELNGIISGGDFSKRISVSPSGDEFSELQVFLNKLLAKLDTVLRSMRSSIDNLAHEMRSPLTRFRSSAERALSDSGDSRLVTDALETCTEEAAHLLDLVTTIMDISELESGALSLQKERCLLRPLVDQVIDLHEIEAEQKNIIVSSVIPTSMEIFVDRTRFLQALSNVVANAVKYSSPHTTVDIRAEASEHALKLLVEDRGVGIAEDHIGKIWDRLYRVDKSRASSGLGLGLSIVKSIVEAHEGSVCVKSVVGEGSVFTMEFPNTDNDFGR